MLRGKYGRTKAKLSRSEQLQEKVDAYLDNRSRVLNELTSSITVDSKGEEEKCSIEAIKSSQRPYTVMSVENCSKILSKIKKGADVDEVIETDEFDDDDEDDEDVAGSGYKPQETQEHVVFGCDV